MKRRWVAAWSTAGRIDTEATQQGDIRWSETKLSCLGTVRLPQSGFHVQAVESFVTEIHRGIIGRRAWRVNR